jgi:cytoskeletal protein CcmA (bactofilin family)
MVKINGYFKGKLVTAETVYIGESAKIDGDIEAENVIIKGNVKGNVTARMKIHLTSTSKLEGFMIAQNFIIDKGAFFSGNCKPIQARAVS